MRTPKAELERSAVEALVQACRSVGLDVTAQPHAGDADLLIARSNDRPLAVEVRARAVADGNVSSDQAPGQAVVVVADVVTARVRRAYRDAGVGWLDRRGHLRIDGPGLQIETEVASIVRDRPTADGPSDDPFGRGRGTIEVALALLLHPDQPPGIRALGRQVGLAPSTISQARDRLQRAMLLTDTGQPLLPELFWELAERWRPRWHPLARDPNAYSSPPRTLEEHAWVRTGDVAAAIHGAPLAVGKEAPGQYYVDGPTELRQARRLLGDAPAMEAGCRVAVAPSRLVMTEAEDTSEATAAPWTAGQLAPEVVVALDLSQDPSRGREVLASWHPTNQGAEAPWSG